MASIFAAGLWLGYQYATGKEAKKDIKIITNELENHNEDLISLQEHTRLIEETKRQAQKRNEGIPRVDTDIVCPISEHERMWNQAVRNANPMPIQN